MELFALLLSGSSAWSSLVLLALTALVVVGQLTVPEGGAAGEETPAGGTEDGADPGTDHPAADGDRPAAAAAGAEDEPDEDEADLPPDVRDDPKRLRTRYRRLQRQHGIVARVAERFRGADGRYLPPEEIDRIRARAADMDEVQELLDGHPDLVQQMLERKRGAGRVAEPADEAWQDPYAAQLDKLPFDPEHASSQWFLNEFRRLDKVNHELRTALKRVEQGVGSVQQRETQRTEQQIEGTWKAETLAAAKTANLTGEDLEDFVNTVYANFRAGKAERRLDKLNRQQIIDRALRPFRRARTAGSRQAAVGAHTRAEGNRTLPGPHSRAAASPATAHDTNTVGTIKEGRKSFFKRLEMQAPPGR